MSEGALDVGGDGSGWSVPSPSPSELRLRTIDLCISASDPLYDEGGRPLDDEGTSSAHEDRWEEDVGGWPGRGMDGEGPGMGKANERVTGEVDHVEGAACVLEGVGTAGSGMVGGREWGEREKEGRLVRLIGWRSSASRSRGSSDGR